MKSTTFLLPLAFASIAAWAPVAKAAPSFPFEGLLPRAETVFIGTVATQTDKQEVTITVSETLRGEKVSEFTFAADRKLAPNMRCFVISQGDNYWGKPQPKIMVGQGMVGQISYCGWLLFPLENKGKDTYLGNIGSRRYKGVTLNGAKNLVKQIPYEPDLFTKPKAVIG